MNHTVTDTYGEFSPTQHTVSQFGMIYIEAANTEMCTLISNLKQSVPDWADRKSPTTTAKIRQMILDNGFVFETVRTPDKRYALAVYPLCPIARRVTLAAVHGMTST